MTENLEKAQAKLARAEERLEQRRELLAAELSGEVKRVRAVLRLLAKVTPHSDGKVNEALSKAQRSLLDALILMVDAELTPQVIALAVGPEA